MFGKLYDVNDKWIINKFYEEFFGKIFNKYDKWVYYLKKWIWI